jgi:outer membrane protein assembly factor BamB
MCNQMQSGVKKNFLTDIIIILLLLMTCPLYGAGEKASNYSSAPIWTYGSDLPVKNIAVADLNGDSVADVIAAEYDSDDYSATSFVIAINGLTGDTLWTFQKYDGIRALAVGDITGDGVADVFAGGSLGTDAFVDGRVHAINGATGAQLWNYSIGATIEEIVIGNFNNTGNLDVAAVGFDDYVHAINGDNGVVLWTEFAGSIFINAAAVADVDGDGIDDVAYAHEYLAGYDNYLGILSGIDGSIIWELVLPEFAVEIAIADIDDDGILEAAFGCLFADDHGEIVVRDALSGSVEWTYDLGPINHVNGNISFTVVDYDDDKDLDLAVGNALGFRQVLIFDGDVNTPMFISDTLTNYPRQITFGDVDGDGILDIVTASWDRVAIIDAITGDRKWYYAVDGLINSVQCADLDGDDIDDIAAGGGAEYNPDPAKTVWALKTVQTPLLWEYEFGEYGNALTITDLNDDGHDDVVTVSSIDDQAVAIDGKTGDVILWQWTGTENLYTITHGDFDNDGLPDIAVAGNDDMVTALDGSSGDVMWQFTTPTDQIYRACLDATDLNGDGAIDVIAGTDDSHVYAINGTTGMEIWNCPAGADIEEVEVAQMNGTGPLDVIAATTGGTTGKKVIVIDGASGSILWEYVGPNTVGYIEVFDANEDGTPDIAAAITAAPEQVIMIDGATHDTLWTALVDFNTNAYAFGQGDIDGDKTIDVLAGGSSTDKTVHVFHGLTGAEIQTFTIGAKIECVLGYDVDGDTYEEIIIGGDDNHVYAVNGSGDVLLDYSTADAVKHIEVGDISANTEPNIACLTFGSDGVAYAFKSLVPQPNSAPYAPSNPEPEDGSTAILVNSELSWVGGDPDGDATEFDIYLGTASPPPLISSQQSSASYNPVGDLSYGTEFFWQIVSWDEHGVSTPGPEWSFTTEFDVICGDCNDDLTVNVSDAVWIINYVFVGGNAPDPLCEGDVNKEDAVNVSDAVYIINYVFVAGDPPVDNCCE